MKKIMLMRQHKVMLKTKIDYNIKYIKKTIHKHFVVFMYSFFY